MTRKLKLLRIIFTGYIDFVKHAARLCSAFFLILTPLCLVATAGAQQNKACRKDIHFTNLPFLVTPDTANKVEVALFFSYGTLPSHTLELALRDWFQNAHPQTKIRRLPVVTGDPLWLLYAQTYYGARILGLLNKTHMALFDSARDQELNTPDEVDAFYAEYGLRKGRLTGLFASEEIHQAIVEAKAAMAAYQIRAVPALVVGGRYRLEMDRFEDEHEQLACVGFLVQEELLHYRPTD